MLSRRLGRSRRTEAPGLECTARRRGRTVFMRVAGTLDGSTADALDAALRDATPHTSHLDLDLQLVERVDAEGVARLLAAHDLVTGAGVTFRVIGASRTLLRALEARGIAAFLHVAD